MTSLPEAVQRTGLTVGKSTRNYLMLVGLVSEDGSMDMHDLGDYAVSNIEKVLARVPGVGEVEIFGTQYAMRIWLNPDKLTDYHLTFADVITALKAYNVEVSAGQIGGGPAAPGQRLNASIAVQSLLKTPEEFAAIPLRITPDSSIVRIRDVGRAELGTEFYDIDANRDGKPSAALAVRMAAGAGAQNAIGTSVLGGMVTGTFLAVFFIPLFYYLISRLIERKKHGQTKAASSANTVSPEDH
jgi:HAE1 family hydrophobic/amphiphilic exporter-1